MNKLSTDQRTRIVSALVEGNSIRSIARMTGVSRNTVDKLLCDLGQVCFKYQDKAFRNLKSKRIQCDEIWSFIYAKEKNWLLAKLNKRNFVAILNDNRIVWIRIIRTKRRKRRAAVQTQNCNTSPRSQQARDHEICSNSLH